MLVAHNLTQIILLPLTAACTHCLAVQEQELWLCRTSVGPGETLPWEILIETDAFL